MQRGLAWLNKENKRCETAHRGWRKTRKIVGEQLSFDANEERREREREEEREELGGVTEKRRVPGLLELEERIKEKREKCV